MTLGGPIKFNAKGQVEGIGSACVQNLNLTPTVVLPKRRRDGEAGVSGAGIQEGIEGQLESALSCRLT